MKPPNELLNFIPCRSVEDRYDPDLDGDFILGHDESEDWYVGLD